MSKLQKLVFSVRETMPFFVSSLRTVDKCKRIQAKKFKTITRKVEASAKHVKSPFARSVNVEDLLNYLDDTVLDINFMAQLPSIEKCLEEWWNLYAHNRQTIDQNILRSFYYDLASVLVEAKTEIGYRNSVSIIMRSNWFKWNLKEQPLIKKEFNRLLFTLAYLMTPTNRLGDYVIFLNDTMGKISRKNRMKLLRTERQSEMVLGSRGGILNEGLSIQNGQMLIQCDDATLSDDEEQAENCYVKIFKRHLQNQRNGVDPLLNDRHFQDKFWQPVEKLRNNTISMNKMAVAINPISNKFCPPLVVSQLRSYASIKSSSVRHQQTDAAAFKVRKLTVANNFTHSLASESRLQRIWTERSLNLHIAVSTPALGGENKCDAPSDTREYELMRRSLSRVTLQTRIDRNKIFSVGKSKARCQEASRKREGEETKNISLSITT